MQEEKTTYGLARFSKDITWERIPVDVIQRAKELILDSIACILGGAVTVQGKKIINLYSQMGGKPEVTVFGTSHRLPHLNAIYVNSYLATVLDYDDTYDGHPGSTVVPVALSLGELAGINGKELIEAVVTGYEIGIRVSNGIKPSSQRTRLVRGINTWQIFCATAVASKLLGLDETRTAHAFGHAAIHASVPSLRKWGFGDGSIQWLKNNFGWTSYGGVLSALLAREDFVADTTIFDGPSGFWIMASSDRCDYEALLEPLGKYYTAKVHLKPYPACRHIHPTLDAASIIANDFTPNPSDIEKIEIETFYEVCDYYAFLPSVPFDSAFSAPYLVSLVFHGIPAGPDWQNEKPLQDESILSLAKKVQISEWDEASRLYPLVKRELMSRVRVITFKGDVFEQEIRIPKGDPRKPLTENELKQKFFNIGEGVLGTPKAEALYDMVMNDLEHMADVKELSEVMRN